jgi:methionyl-tRNA synthetase
MDQALSLLPADYWRWWLLSHAPESSDSEFTWENFQQSVNKDLSDVLGNFVSRITKFCRSKFSEAVPAGGAYGDIENALIVDLSEKLKTYETNLSDIDVRKSAASLRSIWVAGNEYLQNTAPWATFKTDPEQAAAQVRLGLNLIGLYARLSAPFIPDTAEKIKEALNMTDLDWPTDIAATLDEFKVGHAFTVPENLFVKIDDDQRAEWQEKFSGKRD